MNLELFNEKAHRLVAEMLDEAEDRLVRLGVCEPHEADEHLTIAYIAECGAFLEHAAVYLPNEERIAADLFLSKLPTKKAKPSPHRLRICAIQLSRHTHVYFPNYHKLLRIAYLHVLSVAADTDVLRRSGVLMLAAATLPGVRSDIRREMRRRGETYSGLIVPDDVLSIRLGHTAPMELKRLITPMKTKIRGTVV